MYGRGQGRLQRLRGGYMERLQNLNPCPAAARLRHCREVTVEFRNQAAGLRLTPGGRTADDTKMVGVGLLHDIDSATSDRVEALAGRIVSNIVHTLADG